MSSSATGAQRILAVDPGRDKCGVAVVERDGQVVHRSVVPASQVGQEVQRLVAEHDVGSVLLGDRTAAKTVARLLRSLGVQPVIVDEHRSTEEGRRRYFQENPPRGWRRLLPVSLQTPPRAYDDYVAVVLAERYLKLARPR